MSDHLDPNYWRALGMPGMAALVEYEPPRPPQWAARAASLTRLRLKAFKLTTLQADELEEFTGQRDKLFGYPVVERPV